MNKITIELSEQDRALLNKVVDRLEAQISLITFIIDHGVGQPKQAVVDRAKNAPGEAEKIDPPITPETEETPTATEEPQQTVTLAQIQQKVVQLAAGSNGAKKAKVREIINAYAKKVSDLPEDKWTEVWNDLTALENEE